MVLLQIFCTSIEYLRLSAIKIFLNPNWQKTEICHGNTILVFICNGLRIMNLGILFTNNIVSLYHEIHFEIVHHNQTICTNDF